MLKNIVEATTNNISNNVKESLKSEQVRKDMLELYGPEAFLDQENLKYPVMNPNSGKFRSDLIYSAYVHAAIQESKSEDEEKGEYYTNIKNKAQELFEEKGCATELNVKIQGFEHSVIDITELMYLNTEELNLDWIE
jgi:hypothetical protein